MEQKRVSVRTMIEQVMVSGDLRFDASAQRMLDGIRGHQTLQAAPDPLARNEVSVQLTLETDEVALTVYGRIDRLYGLSRVEEIKTTYADVTEEAQVHPQHRMQALCYAHMLCRAEGLASIEVSVTYLNLNSGEVHTFTTPYTAEALSAAFRSVADRYLGQLLIELRHARSLGSALREAKFPFPVYRKGQRELAEQVFWTIREQQTLLVSAPTGTGKTMAVLFPALKAVGEGLTDRLFYLTARTTQQRAAIDAVRLLRVPHLRAVVITAREKACIHDAPVCRTGYCVRAEGYYDRLDNAIAEAVAFDGVYDAARVRALADRHTLCPFELALDLSNTADVIIGDYNYAFDPRVRLQRYFQRGRKRQTLLIDEAHNLPDRGRGMYSAELTLRTVADARKTVPKPHRKGKLYRSLTALMAGIKACFPGDEPWVGESQPRELIAQAEKTLPLLRDEDVPADTQKVRELLFMLSSFLFAGALYGDEYVTLYEGGKTTRRITLFCTDSARMLSETYGQCRGAVLFSATLSPFPFYRALCGLASDAPMLDLPSPFCPEQLLVLHERVSTRYVDRLQTLDRIAASVCAFVSQRKNANYLVYLPSHAYLGALHGRLMALLPDGCRLLTQSPRMGDDERAAFLAAFVPDPDGVTVGLAVLGGVFAEGVDLPAERLCGAAIVGVGLPQLGPERNVLQEAYEERYQSGYDYAYRFPGMCKVLQAAGRILRSETDRGALLLLDDRYDQAAYRALMPPLWQVTRVRGAGEVASRCRAFWEEA